MDLANLTEEQYFAAMKEMFNTDGWSVMMAEFKDNIAIINDVQSIANPDELHFRKGQLAAIAYIMNFPEIIKRGEEDYYASQETLTDESI